MAENFFRAFSIIAAIILVDLALSGDNALVIGAAASKLRGRERRLAITIGGATAAVLRILLTFVAVYLLQFPFINTIGGVIIFVIALLLLRDVEEAEEILDREQSSATIKKSQSKLIAVFWTITFADLSMSLDNVLAIAGLAHGNYVYLTIGLVVSVALLLITSSVIAHLMERFPLLLYLAGGVLALTAANMFVEDQAMQPILRHLQSLTMVSVADAIRVVLVGFFAVWSTIYWFSHRKTVSIAQDD